MRLLHTADWHIGRSLMGCPREEDIRAAIEQIIGIARDERPDLIVHAGDVFDGLRPAYQDLQWGVDALRELAGVAPTVVLCGNHDSPALFTLLDRLLGAGSRLRFVPRALPPELGGVLALPGPRDEPIRPRRLPGPATGRYAGSVVQLDFGEVEERKEVVIVDAEPGRPARVEARPLAVARPLRRIEGTLAEIGALAPSVGRALCSVVVRTESVTPNLSHQLADLLPDALLLNVREDCAATRVPVLTEADAADDP